MATSKSGRPQKTHRFDDTRLDEALDEVYGQLNALHDARESTPSALSVLDPDDKPPSLRGEAGLRYVTAFEDAAMWSVKALTKRAMIDVAVDKPGEGPKDASDTGQGKK